MITLKNSTALVALALCALLCGEGSATTIQTKSDLKGVVLAPLALLPYSPEKGKKLDETCSGYRARKLTAIGSRVEKLGWIATSEAQLGRYHVVTFVSGFTPGMSGLCFAHHANIGIFDGTSLVALAYTPRESAGPLGIVEAMENGALLIWTDPPGNPIGELHADAGGLRLSAVATTRTFCHGRAVVPNIYGKPIIAARKVLFSYGWRPQRPSAPGEWDGASELHKQGIVEADGCAGTGVGYCGFKYRGPGGLLSVTTTDEDASVSSYDVSCFAK